VGRVVAHAIERGATLDALTGDELRGFSPLFGDDAVLAVTLEASLRARAVIGGTAPDAVRRALETARRLVGPGEGRRGPLPS
jgi:argininosuccinate lyase